MRVPFDRCCALVLAGIVWATPAIQAQKPAIADVLKAAGDYLVQYSQKVAALAAEEEYMQYDVTTGTMTTPKRLSSDVVLYGSGDGVITGFRDVFAIDTKPVRQRDDRLAAIFKHPPTDFGQQAQRLTDDSIRHYYSPNLQALDQPTLALLFLRRENQERSTFKLDGVKNMNGAQVAVVKFTERPGEPLIPTTEHGSAVGRAWIDVATGAVRQTELGITTKSLSIRVSVKYTEDAAVKLWVPAEMYQQFEWSGQGSGGMNNMGSGGGYNARQSLEGRATYGKFRPLTGGTAPQGTQRD